MYYQQDEEAYRQQQQPGVQPQFFPGFPGLPGYPSDLNQRVRRLEEQSFRLQTEVGRLNRRVSNIERRLGGYGGGGGYFPYGQES